MSDTARAAQREVGDEAGGMRGDPMTLPRREGLGVKGSAWSMEPLVELDQDPQAVLAAHMTEHAASQARELGLASIVGLPRARAAPGPDRGRPGGRG